MAEIATLWRLRKGGLQRVRLRRRCVQIMRATLGKKVQAAPKQLHGLPSRALAKPDQLFERCASL